MDTYRLPLFPLEVVLFPGQRLPLHIFEDRYKIMIGECVADGAPFGVVLAGRSGIHKFGCTARVARTLEKFPDGRMNILTLGERRFELFRTYDVRPYFEGEVRDYHDEEEEDAAELCQSVRAAFDERRADAANLPEGLENNPYLFSFAIAEALRLPLAEKQSFLESRSLKWRLERLLALLQNPFGKAAGESSFGAFRNESPRNGRP